VAFAQPVPWVKPTFNRDASKLLGATSTELATPIDGRPQRRFCSGACRAQFSRDRRERQVAETIAGLMGLSREPDLTPGNGCYRSLTVLDSARNEGSAHRLAPRPGNNGPPDRLP